MTTRVRPGEASCERCAAVGAAAAAAAGVGTAGAAECRLLEHDWKVYVSCPPISEPTGPIVEAGALAVEACTDDDGTRYMLVGGPSGYGYVPKSATVPC